MFKFLACLAVGATLVAVDANGSSASAQVRPMHSGHMSHGAAQMRRHASGLHHPNRPHFHHHFGYPGYRPSHHHHHTY